VLGVLAIAFAVAAEHIVNLRAIVTGKPRRTSPRACGQTGVDVWLFLLGASEAHQTLRETRVELVLALEFCEATTAALGVHLFAGVAPRGRRRVVGARH